MSNWKHKVKIKHLLDEKEDHESVQANMTAIADELRKHPCFREFGYFDNFRNIPAGDAVISPVSYANRLLELMYNYADRNRIWIE